MVNCPYPGCNEQLPAAPLQMVCKTFLQSIKYYCAMPGCGRTLRPDRYCSQGHKTTNPDPFVDMHCHCPRCGIDIPDKPLSCPSCHQGFEYHCTNCGIDLIPTAPKCEDQPIDYRAPGETDPVCHFDFLGLCPQYPTP